MYTTRQFHRLGALPRLRFLSLQASRRQGTSYCIPCKLQEVFGRRVLRLERVIRIWERGDFE